MTRGLVGACQHSQQQIRIIITRSCICLLQSFKSSGTFPPLIDALLLPTTNTYSNVLPLCFVYRSRICIDGDWGVPGTPIWITIFSFDLFCCLIHTCRNTLARFALCLTTSLQDARTHEWFRLETFESASLLSTAQHCKRYSNLTISAVKLEGKEWDQATRCHVRLMYTMIKAHTHIYTNTHTHKRRFLLSNM